MDKSEDGTPICLTFWYAYFGASESTKLKISREVYDKNAEEGEDGGDAEEVRLARPGRRRRRVGGPAVPLPPLRRRLLLPFFHCLLCLLFSMLLLLLLSFLLLLIFLLLLLPLLLFLFLQFSLNSNRSYLYLAYDTLGVT